MYSRLLDCLERLPHGYFTDPQRRSKSPEPLLISLQSDVCEKIRETGFPVLSAASVPEERFRALLRHLLAAYSACEGVLLIRPEEVFDWQSYEQAQWMVECVGTEVDVKLCLLGDENRIERTSKTGLRAALRTALKSAVPISGSVGEIASRFLASIPTRYLSQHEPRFLAEFELSCLGSPATDLAKVLAQKGLPVEPFNRAVRRCVAEALTA